MSLPVCIVDLQAKGALDAATAKRFQRMYDERVESLRKAMGDAGAEGRATADTIAAIEAEMAVADRQKLLQVKVQSDILKAVNDGMKKGIRADQVMRALFDKVHAVKGVSNIEARYAAIRGQAHAKVTAILEKFDHTLIGSPRNPAQMRNIVRELFGEASGDAAAREMAQSWSGAAEMLRQRYNAAGGHIGQLADWGLPQAHVMLKVRHATFEAWRDFILPKLAVDRMIDDVTGQPFTGPALEAALRDVHASIRSDGLDDMTPGAVGGSKLANRRADSRFLKFTDADAWLEYQARFGVENPFDAMMGHIDGMARDIAQLEILGPSPSHTVQWLGDLLAQDVAVSTATGAAHLKLQSQAAASSYAMRQMLAVFTGELNRPVNSEVARALGAVRSVQTAAKLGGAALSAVTDLGFQKVTTDFNGLEYSRVIANYAKLLNPLDAGDREFAMSSGLIADEAASRMGSLWRFDDQVNSPEVTRRMANGVLRLSGLSAWTQAGKWAFGMEFMHALGKASKLDWAGLDPKLRGALETYGLDELDWSVIRETPLYEHNGSQYLRPDDVSAAGRVAGRDADALTTKLLEMIHSETRFAVPEASLAARAAMAGGARPGTVVGELTRSVMQFKAFPVSILLTHGLRAFAQKGAMSKAAYVANLAIMTTAFGAMAIQLKAIAAGKDPRDMKDDKFWRAAMSQGGGAGILGDFLYADTNRFGGNIYSTLAGPTLTTAVGAVDLTVGNTQQLINGDDTNFGREALSLAQANIPGSSLWYSRLALQRVFFDQLQAEVDPNAHQAFARMEKRASKDFDQSYFWAPGETAPDRAPDFTAIDGGSQ